MRNDPVVRGSFRDPSGFLFHRDGTLYRQVNAVYKSHYELLMNSGLYGALVERGLLVPHREIDESPAEAETAFRIIQPEPIRFISYPYEWCFSQLKDAAMATLSVHKAAMEHGLILKDASAYNIQFSGGKPLLIDTLSFEKYTEGLPWIAYRQFCQHFLAPLALMSRVDVRLGQLLRIHIDGIPLDLASGLLPWRSRLSFRLLVHIHLHAASQKRYESKPVSPARRGMSRQAMLGLIDSLESTVKSLEWKDAGTQWGEYYQDTNYTTEAFARKQETLLRYIKAISPSVVWDLGANTGVFSRIAAQIGAQVVSFDMDPAAVEKNYLQCKCEGEKNIQPFVLDLTNPSPGIGWDNKERMALAQRGPADLALALALIHHLAISNNVPFSMIACFLHDMCRSLVIEFVPKKDSQVQRLLATREDVFPDYTREVFEKEFTLFFDISASEKIPQSERMLYLMHRKGSYHQ
jgi:ribosomal protein L11 methylase PrmA